nr:hypothetical protein [Tanacetum cinerariifolium]
MFDASSAVTYMSIYTDSEPWRYHGEELAETGSPGVVIYGYDGLPIQTVASPSPDYDPEEDPKEDHADYPADGGDGNDEPFDDDDDRAPLGYRAVGIKMRALLLSTSPRTHIPEADMPPQKRACLTTPALGFKVRESSAAGAARQPRPDLKSDHRRYRVEQSAYGITDTWDEIVDTLMKIAPITLEGKMAPNKRTMRSTPATTTTPTTTVIYAQLQAQTDRGVVAASAKHDADRSRNGDNINDSGTGRRRQVPTQ